VSVATLAPQSGQRQSFGQAAGMIDASDSKLDILECVLLAHVAAKTPIDSSTDALATAMIEHSDNDAGQSLWNGLGSAPAISRCNAQLGLTRTVPDPNGYYGLTTSGAGDQIALLDNLVRTDGPLDPPSRAYALNLLHNVEADQTWGVTAAADAGSTSAVKNGWLAVDADNDLWEVNSDGIVTVDGRPLLISVFTAHNPSEQAGITLVESIARAVAQPAA
jgi:Beta-lactamase enzyme family